MTPTPGRLLLSGGGLRAAVGSLGAVAYLVHSDRWEHITEVVSVSGGSIANAALATAPPSAEPWQVLADTVERIDDDKGRVWATPQRALITVWAIAFFAAIVGLLAVAVGVGPPIPALASVLVGLLVLPVVLRVSGRVASSLTRDFIRVVGGTGSEAPLVAVNDAPRSHVFCASGLSSATPYTLWSGKPIDADRVRWGATLQAPYTILDAALASVSLPFLGRVTTPKNPTDPDLLRGGEVLVDGGVSGIFGDQYGTAFRRTPADTRRSGAGILAIDAGRHVKSPSPLSRRLTRNSAVATLTRWLTASLEATYVNDLMDLSPERLVRLCESDDGLEPDTPEPAKLPPALALRLSGIESIAPDAVSKHRLDALRERVATTSLVNLDSPRIDDALTAGFVGTLLAFEPTADADHIHAALVGAETQLRLGSRLSSVWAAFA